MLSDRHDLMWKRHFLDVSDFGLIIFGIGSLVMSIVDLAQFNRRGVIFFIIAGICLLFHATCIALLEYRRALEGKTLFGGKIADLIFVARKCKSDRVRYYKRR